MEGKFEHIILRKEDHIATVTLNRPKKLNATTIMTLGEMAAAFNTIQADDDVRVVILTGAGRGFCSGADIYEQEPKFVEFATTKAAHKVQAEMQKALSTARAIYNVGKPLIAMVNGIVIGGGLDFALACDIRTGSENSRFMSGFGRLGLIPGMGQLWRLPRIVGVAKAAEMIYTCDFIEAEEAYRIGLLNQLWPSAELESRTMEMAQKIAAKPPLAMKLDRLNILRGLATDFDTALEAVSIAQGIVMISNDHAEAYRAFVEKRVGVFKGE